jgi:hypothetical protein
MSSFDPATFLDAIITEVSEKRQPLPAGDYTAIISDISSRAWTGKADTSKSGIALDVAFTIEVPADLQASLPCGATIPNKDSIMFDLTPGGTIDMTPGKNRRLRLYREALDMNKAGEPFSPRAMIGKPIRVKISHELYNDEIQERVSSVTKL